MNSASNKITDAELDIMQVIWDAECPMAFARICAALDSRLKKVTIQTLITRLVDKGVLNQEKKEVYYYTPAVSRKEYEETKTAELISKVYRGDVKKLVASLIGNQAVSPDDLDELRNYWEGLDEHE